MIKKIEACIAGQMAAWSTPEWKITKKENIVTLKKVDPDHGNVAVNINLDLQPVYTIVS